MVLVKKKKTIVNGCRKWDKKKMEMKKRKEKSRKASLIDTQIDT